MQPCTDRFLAEIRKSHTVYSYVDILSADQQSFRLVATGGEVQIDRTAAVRRTCTVDCIDPTGQLTPDALSSILAPGGSELRAYRGVRYSDGTTEVMPLGVFRLSKVTVLDASAAGITIKAEGSDYSRTVSRDKFTVPYVIAAGTNIVTAIKDILALTFPDLQYDAISTSLTTTAPLLYDANDDPWEVVCKLADSIGCEVFFDAVGDCAIAPVADIDALPSPSFTYIAGEGCTLLELERVFTDEPGFNGVIVTGTSPGDELDPVRAEAWDTEATSPTYYLGPYGQVPMFVQDQLVKTEEDAQNAAEGQLRRMLGFASQLTIKAIVNPALDVGDAVQVERSASNVTGLYLVDAMTIPLSVSGNPGTGGGSSGGSSGGSDGGGTQDLILRQRRHV